MRHGREAPCSEKFCLHSSQRVREQADGWLDAPCVALCVGTTAGSGAGTGRGIISLRTGGSGEHSTDFGRVLPSSIHLFQKEEPRTQQWPDTHPSHVTDAEYPVDDVFVDVCRDELHLDGPVAPRRLLGPVLHAELRQGEGSQKEAKDMDWGRVSVSLIPEPAGHAG